MSEKQENKTRIGRIIIGVATIAMMILLIGLFILKSVLEAIIRIAINLPGAQVFLGPNPTPSSILPVLIVIAVLIFSPVLLAILHGFLEAIGGNRTPANADTYPAAPNKNRQRQRQRIAGENNEIDWEQVSPKLLEELLQKPDDEFLEIFRNTPDPVVNEFLDPLDNSQLQQIQGKIDRIKKKAGITTTDESKDATGSKQSISQNQKRPNTGDDGLDQILKEVDEEERHDWK